MKYGNCIIIIIIIKLKKEQVAVGSHFLGTDFEERVKSLIECRVRCQYLNLINYYKLLYFNLEYSPEISGIVINLDY